MTAPVRRRRPGPRRALTEDEILDAALSLLDDGGANAPDTGSALAFGSVARYASTIRPLAKTIEKSASRAGFSIASITR